VGPGPHDSDSTAEGPTAEDLLPKLVCLWHDHSFACLGLVCSNPSGISLLVSQAVQGTYPFAYYIVVLVVAVSYLVPSISQDFLMMSSGKRKRDEYPGQLPSGSFVPQQDGSADQIVEFAVSKVPISDKLNSLSSTLLFLILSFYIIHICASWCH
jgi:hypothetical protein